VGFKVIPRRRRQSVAATSTTNTSNVRNQSFRIVADPKIPADLTHVDAHPQTGACYFVVMPSSSVMAEHRAGWKLNERPWLKFIDTNTFRHIFGRYRHRRALFCNWLLWEASWLPRDRKATVVTLYAEALDDNIRALMPVHQQWLNTFLNHRRDFDGVLAHTPWMAKKLTELSGLPSAVLPAGYDERVLGTPQWGAPKPFDAAWYGTMVGKRQALVHRLGQLLGPKLTDLTGHTSRALVDRLQAAKTVLYLGHSNVRSYSTWRTFHAICSSAAIVTEPGDFWPLDAETCIEVPTIDASNIDEVARRLLDLPPQEALRIARHAHERLREFTVARMIDDYLVPNTEPWLK